MIKQFFCCITLFLAFSLVTVSAQDYTTAIGLRLGSPWAASGKHFISDTDAIEVYTGFRFYSLYQSFSIQGAYQIHDDLDFTDIDNLRWYYGFGAGLHFWDYDTGFEGDSPSSVLTLSGYLGLEYTLDDIPLAISLDIVPTLFLGNSAVDGLGFGYGGLAVRYILKD